MKLSNLSLTLGLLFSTSACLFAQTQLFWFPGGNAGGPGTWDTTTPNWTATGPQVDFNPADQAVFEGTGGTVTVATGGVAADSILFDVGGYDITGGPITLTTTGLESDINVAAGSDEIDSALTITYPVGFGDAFATVASGASLTLTGGATMTAPTAGGGNSSMIFGGYGTVDITGGTYSTTTGSVYFGFGNTIVNQTGGTVQGQGGTTLGYAGNVNYTLSGATSIFETQYGDLDVGSSNGGSFTMSGGSVHLGYNQGTPANGGNIIVARSGGTASMSVSGGTILLGQGSTGTTTGNGIFLTDGLTTATESATVNISGGTITTGSFSFGENASGSADGQLPSGTVTTTNTQDAGVLNISGGTVYLGAGGINKASFAPGTTAVNLSGGTIAATANSTSSMNITLGAAETVSSTTVGGVPVYALTPGAATTGNTTFQTADINGIAHNFTLSGVISGTSGFGITVTGTGVLDLSNVANTFSGKSLVSSGTLEAASLGLSSVEVAAGAKLQLDLSSAMAAIASLTLDGPVGASGDASVNLDFTGTDTIASLVINGVSETGVFDAAQLGGTGNGLIDVAAVPEPGTDALLGLGVLGLLVQGYRFRRPTSLNS
jgi:fibronectin-binding autotransporter adhesin